MTMDAPSFSRLPMSRRTKLLITALFLVLMSIPVIHLTRTWQPENPLRFHVVGERIGEVPPYREKIRVLTLEIENTSAASVVLGYGYVEPAEAQERPRILGMLGALVEARGAYDLPMTIGPHKGILCELMFEEGVPHDTPLENVVLDYSWRSTTLKRAQEISAWLHGKLPQNIAQHLPIPETSMDTQPLRPKL
jgi:hypothetical protein